MLFIQTSSGILVFNSFHELSNPPYLVFWKCSSAQCNYLKPKHSHTENAFVPPKISTQSVCTNSHFIWLMTKVLPCLILPAWRCCDCEKVYQLIWIFDFSYGIINALFRTKNNASRRNVMATPFRYFQGGKCIFFVHSKGENVYEMRSLESHHLANIPPPKNAKLEILKCIQFSVRL